MEIVKVFVSLVVAEMPYWALVVIGSMVLGIVAAIVVGGLLSKATFRNRLKKVTTDPDLVVPLIKNKYTPQSLLKKSRVIEGFSKGTDSDVIKLVGMDDLWIENLVQKKRKSDFQRVLTHAPQKGLFKCFLISLERKHFGTLLLKWLSESGDFLFLQRLALSGKGEYYDGREALKLFKDHLDRVREMTGDPEWASRYFAYKMLLYDSDERSRRAIWEGFQDPHPLIRRTLSSEFSSEEREKLYAELLKLFLKDPSYEVRKAVWERIQLEFSDLYSVEVEKLSHDESFHALELLRLDNLADENLALQFLDNPELELRYMASRFLEKSGALERLCLGVDMGDRQMLDRNTQLLNCASEVNITSFLRVIERTHNPATLMVCAKILKKVGNRSLITELARKVFRLMDGERRYMEVYRETLECISKRGNDEALKILDRELVRRKEDEDLLKLILAFLPDRSDAFSLATLLLYLKDPESKAKESVREALGRMSINLVLPELFNILRAERQKYPHTVRIQALLLLAELQMPYCLQTILENLPVIPLEERRGFAEILSDYPRDLFIEKVEGLLQNTDSQIRSALISCLPSTGITEFQPSIRKSLKDADPDVRIASIVALVEFDDSRTLNQTLSILRDPVERVRIEAAKALGSLGSSDVLNKLKDILDDENEVISIKSAAILGLGSSTSMKAIDILTDHLESEDGLVENTIEALAGKREKKEIAHLMENFKDGSPRVRDKLKEAFKGMREAGEKALVELLREAITSLHPFIAEILEGTGFVESSIRNLRHRDPDVRRESAEVLSMIGTQSAFRGVVLAARDPDEEVRVRVVKALEKLATKEGKKILDALSSDPDRRIRKYTHWALERVKAKSL